jgi:hypothetical protein
MKRRPMMLLAFLICVLLAGCCVAAKAGIFGGAKPGSVQDHTAANAPKTIGSRVIDNFEVQFDERNLAADANVGYESGVYKFSLKRTKAGADCAIVCRDKFERHFTVSSAALGELQKLLEEHEISRLNGISLVGTAVQGTDAIDVVYASGESIHASAEGGPRLGFKPRWFVDFFRGLAEQNRQKFGK